MLFVHITTRIEGRKYDNLLTEKGGRGFPTLYFMDSDGSVIAEHDGPRTVKAFRELGARVSGYFQARIGAEKGDPTARIDVVLYEMEFGRLTLADGKKKLEGLGELSEAQKQRLSDIEVNAEVDKILEDLDAQDMDARVEGGRRFDEMRRAGRIPKGERQVQAFWILIMDFAEREKAPDIFEIALDALREKFQDNPYAKRFLDSKQKVLDRLKGEKK